MAAGIVRRIYSTPPTRIAFEVSGNAFLANSAAIPQIKGMDARSLQIVKWRVNNIAIAARLRQTARYIVDLALSNNGMACFLPNEIIE